jgi:translocation and assembly module TamA
MGYSLQGMTQSVFALLIAVTALCSLAHAADPQPYRVEIASVGNGEMDATLRTTSDLMSLRGTAPVSPFGLIARARSDVDRLKAALESFGYYQSSIAIKIDGLAIDNPQLGAALTEVPKGKDAQVVVTSTPGPLYHLRRVDVDGDFPAEVRNTLGLAAGQPAVAAAVLAGGARLLTALQERGFAFAKVDPPVAYEAADAPALDLSFHVVAGPKLNIGEIRLEGLQRVHERLLRARLLLHTGDPYKPSTIEKARHDFLGLNVFSQVSVVVGTEVDATGGVPITFKMRERPRHLIALNAAFSSDLGGSAGVSWTDRNVFGNAEQLTVNAKVINLGGSDTTGIGYDTSVNYLMQDFGRRDQSLQFTVGALKQSLQAYDQTARTSGATLSRKLSSDWTVSVGGTTTDEQIVQNLATFNYVLFALPLNVNFDSTHLAASLDDPRRGMRASLSVAPTLALGHPNSRFVINKIGVSVYFDLDHLLPTDPGRTILAARALAGLAEGAGETSLPPDQRFYAGGSGTIRGYAYQSVGPKFPLGTPDAGLPIGGTAIEAGSLELRQRFGTDWGAAVFADAGQVSGSLRAVPDEFRIGLGAGIRYYTPIGPIRLDVAVPSKSTASDRATPGYASFEIYIGLGQAF